MDPVSWVVLGTVAIATGVATYFVTKNTATSADEHIKEQINSQIVIQQEKDNSHEFSQSIIIGLIFIMLVGICLYLCIKCAINAVYNRRQTQNAQPALDV
jgi:uncharacterized BrkB/YihY/UPF0761 family membrane protein